MFRIGFSKIGNFRIFSLPSRMTTQFLSNHKFCEKKDATESIIKKNEESVSNQMCEKYANKLIKEMEAYLKNEDPAHASENAMQACKSSLIEFVRELENVEPKTKIVPAGPSPKLCDLLQNRLSPEEAKDLRNGWNAAYNFVEIVNGVPRTRSMADYIKENLFKWNVDTTAEMINKSVSRGKMGQLIQYSNNPRRAELNTCYLQKFGKDLPKVYIENEGGLRTHFSKSK